MTLVAGLSGHGGLVVFADSQETVQGYTKKSVEKIDFWTGGKDKLAFVDAGAGSAIHIDKLTQMLGATVSRSTRANEDMNSIFEAMESIVSLYFKEHIFGRALSDKPDLELIIALQPEGSRAQWFHVADGVICYVPAMFKSIGIGCHLADFLLDKLQDFGQHESELLAVATYVLKEVKTNIDGCGLNSTIWLLRTDGTREYFGQDDVAELEAMMNGFNNIVRVAFDAAFDITVHRSSPQNLPAELETIHDCYKLWYESLKERRDAAFRSNYDYEHRLRGT